MTSLSYFYFAVFDRLGKSMACVSDRDLTTASGKFFPHVRSTSCPPVTGLF